MWKWIEYCSTAAERERNKATLLRATRLAGYSNVTSSQDACGKLDAFGKMLAAQQREVARKCPDALDYATLEYVREMPAQNVWISELPADLARPLSPPRFFCTGIQQAHESMISTPSDDLSYPLDILRYNRGQERIAARYSLHLEFRTDLDESWIGLDGQVRAPAAWIAALGEDTAKAILLAGPVSNVVVGWALVDWSLRHGPSNVNTFAADKLRELGDLEQLAQEIDMAGVTRENMFDFANFASVLWALALTTRTKLMGSYPMVDIAAYIIANSEADQGLAELLVDVILQNVRGDDNLQRAITLSTSLEPSPYTRVPIRGSRGQYWPRREPARVFGFDNAQVFESTRYLRSRSIPFLIGLVAAGLVSKNRLYAWLKGAKFARMGDEVTRQNFMQNAQGHAARVLKFATNSLEKFLISLDACFTPRERSLFLSLVSEHAAHLQAQEQNVLSELELGSDRYEIGGSLFFRPSRASWHSVQLQTLPPAASQSSYSLRDTLMCEISDQDDPLDAALVSGRVPYLVAREQTSRLDPRLLRGDSVPAFVFPPPLLATRNGLDYTLTFTQAQLNETPY
jgi:hypothetical protein